METYGSWQNWLVAIFTLAVVTGLNHFAKGFLKLASILVGIIAGYILAACFGMIDFSGIGSSGFFQLPQPLHFGVSFEPSACIAIGVLFAINSIQAIGDLSATTVGSMDREPTTRELQGGIVMYGIENIIGAVFGGLPTATYSQNVGIVTTTKVINRCVLGLACHRSDHRRTGTEILRFADHYSPVCPGRGNYLCICLHCHDRDQAGHAAGNEFPEYFHRRAGRGSGNGRNSGACLFSRFPGLGNHYLRFLTGSPGNHRSNSFKCDPSKRREKTEHCRQVARDAFTSHLLSHIAKTVPPKRNLSRSCPMSHILDSDPWGQLPQVHRFLLGWNSFFFSLYLKSVSFFKYKRYLYK